MESDDEQQQIKPKKERQKYSTYAINEYQEDKLLTIGTVSGRLLCKIKCVKIVLENKQINRKGKTICQNPNPEIAKFWKKRYELFQKYDEGIILDTQSWYSVTPAAVSTYLKNRIQTHTLLDGFCGAGGDSIHLAASSKVVLSNDIDPLKIQCLINNAKIYHVTNIHPICHDYLSIHEYLESIQSKVDVAYLAPPWGGTEYYHAASIGPKDFTPPLDKIISQTISITQNIVMLLPANTNLEELCTTIVQAYRSKGISAISCRIDVQKIVYKKRFKFLAIYMGKYNDNNLSIDSQMDYISKILGMDLVPNKPYHRSFIELIRCKLGMINLLNYVYQCQKYSQTNCQAFIKDLQNYVSVNKLINVQDIVKLKIKMGIEEQVRQNVKIKRYCKLFPESQQIIEDNQYQQIIVSKKNKNKKRKRNQEQIAKNIYL